MKGDGASLEDAAEAVVLFLRGARRKGETRSNLFSAHKELDDLGKIKERPPRSGHACSSSLERWSHRRKLPSSCVATFQSIQ